MNFWVPRHVELVVSEMDYFTVEHKSQADRGCMGLIALLQIGAHAQKFYEKVVPGALIFFVSDQFKEGTTTAILFC